VPPVGVAAELPSGVDFKGSAGTAESGEKEPKYVEQV
jgi:hypothetical protein